ncbi:hypothetical protein DOTSEDRAFT_33216 [Dothistroma septosporum NZE10]|uniref:Uncharacterized protein n=1 Tax=Dothistroma septosporum (strain NZE10 / CBS 128990) TaxID=675120 RepID=N1PWA8_DOTSN|nr:hypothetical protein DOTSEDRAFT_33216 [Dothistroma septosporum NZE10]
MSPSMTRPDRDSLHQWHPLTSSAVQFQPTSSGPRNQTSPPPPHLYKINGTAYSNAARFKPSTCGTPLTHSVPFPVYALSKSLHSPNHASCPSSRTPPYCPPKVAQYTPSPANR